ncbi:MAG: hypothetical protein JXR77_08575, partial [Lentisphaeria bacterium]|nr:hypothetical protein [Lentisphaeria bacterium]
GPCRVRGAGDWPASGLFTTATRVEATLVYEPGIEVHCRTGASRLSFHGSIGELSVERGALRTQPEALAESELGPDAVRLYRSDDHHGNWLDCIRSRKPTVCPPEVGHRSATCCHLVNIAMRLGRELGWDPARESFVDDPEANAMSLRSLREPWATQYRQWLRQATDQDSPAAGR